MPNTIRTAWKQERQSEDPKVARMTDLVQDKYSDRDIHNEVRDSCGLIREMF